MFASLLHDLFALLQMTLRKTHAQMLRGQGVSPRVKQNLFRRQAFPRDLRDDPGFVVSFFARSVEA